MCDIPCVAKVPLFSLETGYGGCSGPLVKVHALLLSFRWQDPPS